MKKLLWCLAAVGVFCVVVVVALGRNPDNAILSISQSRSQGYEQIMVLKRDRTYEQLIRRTGDETIIGHKGTWLPTKEDVNSQLFAAQTGTEIKNYITYKNKLTPYGKSGVFQAMDSMEPPFGMRDPDEESLMKWKEWRAKAQPYTPGQSFTAPPAKPKQSAQQ